jgi:hypothetical protein
MVMEEGVYEEKEKLLDHSIYRSRLYIFFVS